MLHPYKKVVHFQKACRWKPRRCMPLLCVKTDSIKSCPCLSIWCCLLSNPVVADLKFPNQPDEFSVCMKSIFLLPCCGTDDFTCLFWWKSGWVGGCPALPVITNTSIHFRSFPLSAQTIGDMNIHYYLII